MGGSSDGIKAVTKYWVGANHTTSGIRHAAMLAAIVTVKATLYYNVFDAGDQVAIAAASETQCCSTGRSPAPTTDLSRHLVPAGWKAAVQEVRPVGNNSGRNNRLPARARGRLGTIWWKMIWPGLIITCIGLASILFLICCARVSVLELEVGQLERQIDKQMGGQCQLWQRVAELRDRGRLREFVSNTDPPMVLVPADTDLVALPALPEQEWHISPLTPQPQLLAGQPGAPEAPEPPADPAVIAEAF